MMDHTIPICLLPGLGPCVRERCNFWDEESQEYTSDCFDTHNPIDTTSELDPDTSCVISFYEDND